MKKPKPAPAAAITTITTVRTIRREVPSETIETIVASFLGLGEVPKHSIEFDWDASSEGLVRGLTVTTRETEEETR